MKEQSLLTGVVEGVLVLSHYMGEPTTEIKASDFFKHSGSVTHLFGCIPLLVTLPSLTTSTSPYSFLCWDSPKFMG